MMIFRSTAGNLTGPTRSIAPGGEEGAPN